MDYVPEVRDDLIASVGCLLVLLRGALGDFELVRIIDAVGAVGASTNLSAIGAVAQNLWSNSQYNVEGLQDIDIRSQQTRLRPRSGHFRTCILRRPCWIGYMRKKRVGFK